MPLHNTVHAVSAASIAGTGRELQVVFTSGRKGFGGRILELDRSQWKVIGEFTSEPTAKETLRKFLPSKLNQEFKSAQGQAQSRSKSAFDGFSVKQMVIQKTKRFPIESAGFYIALGAVMTYQLMFLESHNPVAYDQLVTSQNSLLGQFSFYMFMLANGITAEPLMTAVKNGKLHPRLGPFIGMFGMASGMVASNVVHELGNSPNLWKCANELRTSQKMGPACDKAAESWYEKGGATGIANEWAPGLISLIGSIVISGQIQSDLMQAGQAIANKRIEGGVVVTSIRATASWTWKQVVKIVGTELAIALISPFGKISTGIKMVRFAKPFLNQVGQMTIFTGVSTILEKPVTLAYRNAVDQGPALRDMETKLLSDLLRMKKDDWMSAQTNDFDSRIAKFTTMMAAWRQVNLAPVLEAQASWDQKIAQLALGYQGAKQFYDGFLQHMWQRKFGPYKDLYAKKTAVRIIDRQFPLNGITPTGLDLTHPEMFTEAPDIVEEGQVATINQVLATYQSGKLLNPQQFEKGEKLSNQDSTVLVSIVKGLMSPDINEIGRSLDQINCRLFGDFESFDATNCKIPLASSTLRKYLLPLRTALGDPRPLWTPGLGYLTIIQNDPDNKSMVENLEYKDQNGYSLGLPELGHSFVAAMAFGPDVENGEEVVQSSKGFKSIFKAPRIRFNQKLTLRQLRGANIPLVNTVFNTPVMADGNKNLTYPSVFNYLNQENILTSVFNEDSAAFTNWWNSYVEPQYVNAWVDYEEKYQENISEFVKLLWSETSVVNRGPMANGIMPSLRQENSFYLMVLGELLKDRLALNSKSIEAKFGSPQLINFTGLELISNKPQFFSLLKQNSLLNFSTYMKIQHLQVNSKFQHPENQNLTWQNEIMRGLFDLERLIAKIQPHEFKTSNGSMRKATKTSISNSQIKNAVDRLNALVDQVKTGQFGIPVNRGETSFEKNLFSENDPGNPQNFSDFQKKIIDKCFKGLEANITQIITLGMIANSVSYVEVHDEKGFTKPRCTDPSPDASSTGKGLKIMHTKQAGC